MNDPRQVNPLAEQAAGPTTDDRAAGSLALPPDATGDAMRGAAYATQSFVRIVAQVLLSSVMALAAQSSAQLALFAENNFLFLVIAHPQHAGSL